MNISTHAYGLIRVEGETELRQFLIRDAAGELRRRRGASGESVGESGEMLRAARDARSRSVSRLIYWMLAAEIGAIAYLLGVYVMYG